MGIGLCPHPSLSVEQNVQIIYDPKNAAGVRSRGSTASPWRTRWGETAAPHQTPAEPRRSVGLDRRRRQRREPWDHSPFERNEVVVQDYLVNHCVLKTADLDACREVAKRIWVNHRSHVIGRGRFNFTTNHVDLNDTALTYFRYSPVHLDGDDGLGRYVVELNESGYTEHIVEGRPALVTPRQALIHSPGQRQIITMHQTRALGLWIQPRFLDQALSQRFRRWRPLQEWVRELPVDSGPLATLKSLCRWAAVELDDRDSGLRQSPKAIAHFERTLRTLLVNGLAAMYPWDEPKDPAIEPRYLRLIEDWMDANIEEPIGIEDLARVAGVGVRALQAAFRRHRDCSPLAALLKRRLHRAQALLLHPLPETTVTGVALTVGHFHLGRFATRYRRAFGESPSDTLARGLRRN